MASLLLFNPRRNVLSTRRSRASERLRARLFPWRLDQALARGVSPDSRGDLAIRAHRLISLRTRQDLVREIYATLHDAMYPPRPWHRVVDGCPIEVLVAAPLLEEAAQRLAHPGPVEAAGVARIRILLHDGTGPLYSETFTGELEPALKRALAALTPRHAHQAIA
jgi:hypothetical protein